MTTPRRPLRPGQPLHIRIGLTVGLGWLSFVVWTLLPIIGFSLVATDPTLNDTAGAFFRVLELWFLYGGWLLAPSVPLDKAALAAGHKGLKALVLVPVLPLLSKESVFYRGTK